MGSSTNIVIILAGVFLAAILLNVYMLRENFGTMSTTDAVNKDAAAAVFGGVRPVQSGSSKNNMLANTSMIMDIDPSRDVIITSEAPKLITSPGLDQGNKFSHLIKQLISGGSTNEDKANKNPTNYNSSYNTLRDSYKKPLDHINPIGKSIDTGLGITPSSQSKDVLNYSLDQKAQQPTTRSTPIVNPTTPFLQQGADYSGNSGINKASSAYAMAQQASRKAEPCPVDLNDYIRKDSIPCYACTLK